MGWLNSSIEEYIKEGSLPSVPNKMRLEQCVYAPMQHPRAAILAKKFLDGSPWAIRDKERIHVINDISSAATYIWPNSVDESRTLTLIKYMQWLFLVDNVVDDLDRPQVDKLCHRLRHHIFGLGASPPALLGDRHLYIEIEPLIISLGLEWWKEIKDSSSPKQQARFAVVFTKYLHYQAALTRMREKIQQEKSLPSLEEYTQLRRFSSGFLTCIVLLEYSMGIELDEETYKSSILQQLVVAVHDHIIYINDIFSFPKEFENGDVLNLLPVLHLCNNEGRGENKATEVPFPVAISQAWQMVKERDIDVACLAQQLRQSLSKKMTPHLDKYVETICTMPASNWEWMLQSPRYQSPTITKSYNAIYTTSSNTKYRSPPLCPPLALSPFKHPLAFSPFKTWRDNLLSKGNPFSFPPQTSLLRHSLL